MLEPKIILEDEDEDEDVPEVFESSRNYPRVVREMGKLLVQIKNTMGVSGTLSMDTSFLEEAGPQDPAEFDILSQLSAKFSLGSAECPVMPCFI